MIITRTPLRLSLIGGGTDMPSFTEFHTGAVISTGINKSIYVSVNPKFDGRYRVSYSITENVDNVSEIQHDIVREALKLFSFKGLEVVSVSDIPGEGSGLGSSSAFAVGLLHALYTYCGYRVPPKQLAEHAFVLESRNCGHPVGRQDHYAAAIGGFAYYEFSGKKVKAENLGLLPDELQMIGSNLMLFWTDYRKDGSSQEILREQMERVGARQKAEESALLMAELAKQMKGEFIRRNFTRVGRFIGASWTIKKRFSSGVSNEWIDGLVVRALEAGAEGAKICGAGGGGFLLVVADPSVQYNVSKAVGLRRVPITIGAKGSHVIYSGA